MTDFQDKEVQCSDCPKTFKLTAAAQKFFTEKGLAVPKRCPECRDKNRAKHEKLGHQQYPKTLHKTRIAPPPAEKPKILSDRELVGDIPPTRTSPTGTRVWEFE